MEDTENKSDEKERKQPEKQELQFKLYKLLLQKYASLINEKEKRTIGEIKGLIAGDDLTVQSIIADFKPEKYEFERNYLGAAKKAFEFVANEIDCIDPGLNLNYWLSPKEIFSERIGDDEDLAVFLCSLLLGLEDENAAVVIAELNNLRTHAFVVTEHKGKFYLLDPGQRHSFTEYSGKKEDVLQHYTLKKAKIKRFLYKFNNKSYEQFI